MLKHILRTATALMGFLALSAQADVAITQVTNQQSATNGCNVISVAGGYNFVIWGVRCPSENGLTVNVQTTWNQYGNCTATAATSGYRTSSNCSNYTVYRISSVPPQGSSSSISLSSSAASSVRSCTTQTINIGQSCNDSWCAEQFGRACSAAGGSVSVEYGGYYCKKTVCQ